jgi:hypothetical protein
MSAESSFSPFVSLPREMLDRIDEGLCAVDRNLRITYLNIARSGSAIFAAGNWSAVSSRKRASNFSAC